MERGERVAADVRRRILFTPLRPFFRLLTSAATTLQVRSLRKELPRYSTNRR